MSDNTQYTRTLTEADVEAIVDAFFKRWFLIVGKGFLGFVLAGVIAVMIFLAGIGMKFK